MDTIVGSSVYNTLIIVGVSAIAGGDMYLDWKPLYRDIGFYYMRAQNPGAAAPASRLRPLRPSPAASHRRSRLVP